ncbi:proteasome component M29 [Entomophthora muscae]|uniref:Proteasome component M29 n=1 Tax=Entomophthora muscae TaxID=34485 RepID=A0ACC2TNC2_9FUNG|nr:proteasome component M29 [Entomophthora muscae]
MSTEEKDLALLDQVELKFALASTEVQLQGLLNQFLAPIIRKATTLHTSVQNKVLEILTHIKKRLQSSPAVFIPGLDLATLLNESSPVAQNLALTFLQSEATKLPNSDQAVLIPKLANGLGSRPKSPVAISIFKLIIQMIPQAVQLPTLKEPAEINVYSCLSDVDREALCETLYQFMLHGWAAFPESAAKETASVKGLQCSIIKYLSQPINQLPKWPFCAYRVVLAGSVASSRDNADLSEGLLKRVERPDWDDAAVLNRLISMYLEKEAPIGLKVKLLDWFPRSTLIAKTFPQVLQVSFDGMHGTNTNPKLRLRALILLQCLIRNREASFISQIAPVLLSGITKVLDDGKITDSRDELSVLGAAYVTLGLLASQAHSAFQKDVLLLSRMFKDLGRYQQLIPQIKDGLSMMLVAYQDIVTWGDVSVQDQLNAILEEAFYSGFPPSRHFSLRYMLALFPETHLPSRFLLIVGTGDQDAAAKETAITGLGKLSLTPGQSNALDLVEYCHARVTINQASFAPHHLPPGGTAGSLVAGYPPAAMLHLILFAWSLATHRPLDSLLDTQDSELEVEGRERLSHLLGDEGLQGSPRLQTLLRYLRDACSQSSDTKLQFVASSMLCQIVCCAPIGLIASLANDMSWFKSMASSGVAEVRTMMARSFSIVLVSSIPHDASDPLAHIAPQLEEALASLAALKAHEIKQHAILVSAGLLVGRFLYRFPHFSSASKVESIIDAILSRIEAKAPPSQIQAAVLALQECGRYGQIPKASDAFDRLSAVLRTTADTKVAEAVLLTLGHLGVGDSSLAQPILQKLLDLPYPLNKNVEVYFRAGEAIACIAGGYSCPLIALHLDVPPHSAPANKAEASILEAVVSQLTTAAKADSPGKRKGAAFCLLSVVKFCHRDTLLTPHYPGLHAVFLSLLTNPDGLVQEVASTGMALIYDHTPEEGKGKLVESLMSIFTHGQSLSQTMAGTDADLYGEGLGRAPDGSSLNSYRSVLSLAADMNQPELIYPFLQLARSNAVWASRQGAAFGLARLLGPARELITPHLPTFLPRLFRFRYDPDAQVAQTMGLIWEGLLQGDSARSQELLDQHFKVICDDLLDGMGDRSWRTRQSSSTALSNLLHGRRDVDFSLYMERVWLMSFRTMDDIKESVREAGLKVSRAASTITIKSVDPDNNTPQQGAAILAVVLPFLVNKGLCSDAEEVRLFSINTILKLVQKAGKLLTPHIASLIPHLLDAMTSMEPPEANYLTFHVDQYNLSQEQLDGYRLASLKKSSLSLALGTCLGLIDEAGLAALIPELTVKIRRSVGFATKAGCARAIAVLASDKAELMRPYSLAIIKAILVALGDNSAALRKLWATTLGAISKLVDVAALSKLLQDICKEYLSLEDAGWRIICAMAILEISKRSSATFQETRDSVLPIAYLGSFDSDPDASRIWGEVWRDNTAGTTSALKCHQEALFCLTLSRFDTTSWTTKQQAAKCTGEAAKQLADGLDYKRTDEILDMLLSQLSGRLWDGKECLLVALEQVVIAGRQHLIGREDIKQTIFQALLRDMKKKNMAFKTKAIQAASEIIPALNINAHDQVFSALLPVIRDGSKDLAQDEDVIEAHAKPRLLVLKSQAVKCVISTLPEDLNDVPPQALVELVVAFSELHVEAWNIRLAVLEGLESVLKKVKAYSGDPKLIVELWAPLMAIFECALKDGKYINIRLAAVNRIVEAADLPHVRTNSQLLEPIRAVIALGCRDPSPQISERLEPISRI